VTMIVDGGNRILVDVGHFGNRDAMLSAMTSRGLKPEDIDIVVLTHIHWDHCLNVDLFEKSKILVGAEEFEKGNLTGYNDHHVENFRTMIKSMQFGKIGDGFQVSEHVKTLLTPGHSVGHISLSVQEQDGLAIISGDAIPNLRAYRRGIPDLIFHDFDEAKKSVRRIKDLKPAKIIPGHDGPFNDAGYLSRDDLNLIFRTEKEENLIVGLRNVVADKPEVLISSS